MTAAHRRKCWRTSPSIIRVDTNCRVRDLKESYEKEMFESLQTMQLDYGKSRPEFIKSAVVYRAMLATVMGPLIARAALRGYEDMASVMGIRPQIGIETGMKNASAARASLSADILLNTTLARLPLPGVELGTDPWAFSQARATAAVGYEGTRAFKGGTLTAAKSTSSHWGKAWLVSDDHDRDDECDENEAVGTIPVGELFPSGDDTEPAHPSCSCEVIYRKMVG